MDIRQEKLKQILERLKPCICSKEEYDLTLERLEKIIVNAVYEDCHGKFLYIRDVIEHFKRLAIEKHLEEHPDVINMMTRLESFKDFIITHKDGSKGERFAERELKNIASKHIRLSNLELNVNESTEIDQIVITKKGIFLIEVKWRNMDMIINTQGNFVEYGMRWSNMSFKNVVDQLHTQRREVFEVLKSDDSFEYNEILKNKIHTVLLFANNKVNIHNKCKDEVVVCRCRDIVNYIEDYDDEAVFTDDDMKCIADKLRSFETSKNYPIKFDIDSLRESIIKGMPILEEDIETVDVKPVEPVKDSSDISNCNKQQCKTGIAFTIGIFVGVGLTYCSKYIKQYIDNNK